MKCVSRDSRSSFATISGQRSRRASAIAASNSGRSSSPPLSTSMKLLVSMKPSSAANRSTVACCASRPRPLRPSLWVVSGFARRGRDGYEPTREATNGGVAKSWRRE